MIRLEAWLTNWLTENLLKEYKIKRNFTYFSKYQINFHLVSWKHQNFHSCCALMKILMFSTHSMKYIWYSPQKSKYPLFNMSCVVIILIICWNIFLMLYKTSQIGSKMANFLFFHPSSAVIFVIPRRSRRDIVLAASVRPSIPSVLPSVRPHFLSVRNHISVPICQI